MITKPNLQIVGLEKDQAIAMLNLAGARYRISREDNVAYMMTADYSPGRYNLVINEGKVTQVSMG